MTEEYARGADDQRARQRTSDTPPAEHYYDAPATEAAGGGNFTPSLLGDPRLSGRGNAPIHTASMLGMQQTRGNKAVQRAVSTRAGGGTVTVQRMFPTLLGLAPMISPLAASLAGPELAMLGIGGGMISPAAYSVPGAALAGGGAAAGGAGGTVVMGAAPTIPGAALAGGGAAAGGAGGTVVMGAAPTIPGAALAGGGAAGGGTVVMGAAPTIPGAALAGGGAGGAGGAGAAAGGVGAAGAGVTAAAVVGSALAGAAIGYGLQKGSGWLGDQVADSAVGEQLGMVPGRDYSIGGAIGNMLTGVDEGAVGFARSMGIADESQPAYQQTFGKRLADWLTPTSNA